MPEYIFPQNFNGLGPVNDIIYSPLLTEKINGEFSFI